MSVIKSKSPEFEKFVDKQIQKITDFVQGITNDIFNKTDDEFTIWMKSFNEDITQDFEDEKRYIQKFEGSFLKCLDFCFENIKAGEIVVDSPNDYETIIKNTFNQFQLDDAIQVLWNPLFKRMNDYFENQDLHQFITPTVAAQINRNLEELSKFSTVLLKGDIQFLKNQQKQMDEKYDEFQEKIRKEKALYQTQEFDFTNAGVCPVQYVAALLPILKKNTAFFCFHQLSKKEFEFSRLSVIVKCQDSDNKTNCSVLEIVPSFQKPELKDQRILSLARDILYNQDYSDDLKCSNLEELQTRILSQVQRMFPSIVNKCRFIDQDEMNVVLEWIFEQGSKDKYRPRGLKLIMKKEDRDRQVFDQNFHQIMKSFQTYLLKNPPPSMKFDLPKMDLLHIELQRFLRREMNISWDNLVQRNMIDSFQITQDILSKDPSKYPSGGKKPWSVPLSQEQAENIFLEKLNSLPSTMNQNQFAMMYVPEDAFPSVLDTFSIVRLKLWNSWTTSSEVSLSSGPTSSSSLSFSNFTHDQVQFNGISYFIVNGSQRKDLTQLRESVFQENLKEKLEGQLDLYLYPTGAAAAATVTTTTGVPLATVLPGYNGSGDLSARQMIQLGREIHHVYGLSDDQVFMLLRKIDLNGRAIFASTMNPCYFFAFFQARDSGKERFVFPYVSPTDATFKKCHDLSEDFEKEALPNAPLVIYRQGILIEPNATRDSFVFKVDPNSQMKLIPAKRKDSGQQKREKETFRDQIRLHPEGKLHSRYQPISHLVSPFKYHAFQPPTSDPPVTVGFETLSELFCYMGIQSLQSNVVERHWNSLMESMKASAPKTIDALFQQNLP